MVELGPVVGNEADPLDRHVVDEPALARAVQAKDHGGLLAPAREDARLNRREVPVHRLADEVNALALVELDLGQVRAVEEGAEEPDEFLPLGIAESAPVAGQGAPGDLGEVEEVGEGWAR